MQLDVEFIQSLYRFISNSHRDVRFSTCLNCAGKTIIRKVPLFIHAQPSHPTTINMNYRYCQKRDILIAYQNELEHMLLLTFEWIV
jgi:hypothetical protein